MIALVIKYWDTISGAVIKFFTEIIPSVFWSVVDWFKSIPDKIKEAFSSLFSWLFGKKKDVDKKDTKGKDKQAEEGFITKLVKMVTKAFNKLKKIVSSFMSIFLDPLLVFIKSVVTALKPILDKFEPIVTAVVSMIDSVKSTINAILFSLMGGFHGLLAFFERVEAGGGFIKYMMKDNTGLLEKDSQVLEAQKTREITYIKELAVSAEWDANRLNRAIREIKQQQTLTGVQNKAADHRKDAQTKIMQRSANNTATSSNR